MSEPQYDDRDAAEFYLSKENRELRAEVERLRSEVTAREQENKDQAIRLNRAEARLAELQLTECSNCHREYPLVITAMELRDGAAIGTWCCICHDQQVLRQAEARLAEVVEAGNDVLEDADDPVEANINRGLNSVQRLRAALADAKGKP